MNRRTRFAAWAAWLVAVVVAQGCAEPRDGRAALTAAAADCSSRVIVGFVAAADANVVAAVAQAAGVRLTVVDQLLPDLYVLDLSTAGPAEACAAALGRVRADARVRSADLDSRLAPHAG